MDDLTMVKAYMAWDYFSRIEQKEEAQRYGGMLEVLIASDNDLTDFDELHGDAIV